MSPCSIFPGQSMTSLPLDFQNVSNRWSWPFCRINRLPYIFLVGFVVFAIRSADAGEPVSINLDKDLKILLPRLEGVHAEVTEDELDKVPVLKLVFPEENMEAWQGHVGYIITPPAEGRYILRFVAKSDPAECQIEVRVWDFSGKQPRVLCPPDGFMLQSDWQEFTYDFVVEAGQQGAATVQWGNLARSGKTITMRNIRLEKH